MHTLTNLQPGTRYEIRVSVIVKTNTGDILYNSSYHQIRTEGFGPDFGKSIA